MVQGLILIHDLRQLVQTMTSKRTMSPRTQAPSPTFSRKAQSKKEDSDNQPSRKTHKDSGQLFILVPHCKYTIYSAHYRVKRGYLEICWREGKRVRTQHIRKDLIDSPTFPALILQKK
jgi:hypothetical protein